MAITDKSRLMELQKELDDLRGRLGVSDRGAVIYQRDLDVFGAESVVVEADGFGGAVLKRVSGNYPSDYLTNVEQSFSSEAEAAAAAERMTLF